MGSLRFLAVFTVSLVLGLTANGQNLGNAWHIPDSAELGGTHMRSPEFEFGSNATITIYNGNQYGGAGNLGDQTGGTLYYKSQSSSGSVPNWTGSALTFDQPSQTSSNKYWKASFSTSQFGPNEVIQYYLQVNYSDHATTFIYGNDSGSLTTATQSVAAGSPFTLRNRPAWVFHANNRVINGSNTDFWAKVGYMTDPNNTSTQWVNNGAIYYTTDGTDPIPGASPGQAAGSTQVAPFAFDHPDNSAAQNAGTQSPAGTPMWFKASVPNLPGFTTIKYKVGFWNSSNNEQKFGDYNAGDGSSAGHIFSFTIGTLGDPSLSVTTPSNGILNADYTTSHLFVDEIAGDSIPVSVVFQPHAVNVDPTTVQVYTNLNRRDLAILPWVDSFGIATEEGINPPSGDVVSTDDAHFYKAYTMTPSGDGVTYTLSLNAQKTGAYRLTARYKVVLNPNTHQLSGWMYYTTNGRRDHAIVVSPTQARNIQLYELNTLNINATGDQAYQRGTFNDLIPGGGKATRAAGAPVADLNYIAGLGCNWLWFQPIHPDGIDGRENFPNQSVPYNVGSPYSVKNFFEVMPLMSLDTANFTGSYTPSANDTAAGRAQARQSFHDFVVAADNSSMGVMLDAPFNHTSWDAEYGTSGPLSGTTLSGVANMNSLIKPGSAPTDQMRNTEARFYSLAGNYAQRASSAANVAQAPDRYDFGKWADVHDIYFGTYSALVDTSSHSGNYNNEGDQLFGYLGSSSYPNGDPNWNSADFNNGANNNITRNVWKYFAQYVPYWLSQTGHVDGSGNLAGNSTAASGGYATRLALDSRGIDGLRADFGQGLPPQCWEYIINVARSYKWNFVFMTESLDGGAVTYRSNRHFDILNENIIFPFQAASVTSDYRGLFDGRRSAYGQGLVLLNNMSHDEQAYADSFQPVIRFGVASTIDGAPMVFYGQENGISGPVGGTSGTSFGFHYYETNFGKLVAQFKQYNDLGPILGNQGNGVQFLKPVYSAINQARQFSQALRSSNRYYLNQTDGSIQQHIFSIAKYQTANASPGQSDVVFGFVNLDRSNQQAGNYNVNITQNGSNLFGINSSRTYNARNIAAYTGFNSNRRNDWLWNSSSGYSGGTVLNNGVFVSLNPVPGTDTGWSTAPFEVQYLKLYDISAPDTPAPGPQVGNIYSYALGNTVTFGWSADPNVNPSYMVTVTVNGGTPFTITTLATSYTYTGNFGDVVSIVVKATNPDSSAQSGGSVASSVTLLDPNADSDGDGMTNRAEDIAGTNPLNAASVFRITGVTTSAITWSSVAGKTYKLERTDPTTMPTPGPGGPYSVVESQVTATGPSTTQSFTRTAGAFYKVEVIP